jgi:hypothetical protein
MVDSGRHNLIVRTMSDPMEEVYGLFRVRLAAKAGTAWRQWLTRLGPMLPELAKSSAVKWIANVSDPGPTLQLARILSLRGMFLM